jgi:hypothetical protein
MKRPLTNVLSASLLLVLAACASAGPAAPTASSKPDTTRPGAAEVKKGSQPVAEDLSKYRPKFDVPAAPKAAPTKAYVTPTNHVNAQVEQRLRDLAFTNQNVKYTNGWRIQAYIGLEREQAMAIRRAVISRYPEETDYLTFKQPIYRLYIGDYTSRLEAERAMMLIRPLAPKAELQFTQVLINKTRF